MLKSRLAVSLFLSILLIPILGCSLAGSASQVAQPVTKVVVVPSTATQSATPTPTVTPTLQLQANVGNPPVVVRCYVRTDWPIYVVVHGDNLGSIAKRVGSTTTALAQANCLANPNVIVVGQQLRVPRLPAQQFPTPIPLPIYDFGPTPPFDICGVQRIAGVVYIYRFPGGREIGLLMSWANRLRTVGDWHEIDLQDGTTGFVRASAVRLFGLCPKPPVPAPPTIPPPTSVPTLPVFMSEGQPPYDACIVQLPSANPGLVFVVATPENPYPIGILGNWLLRLRTSGGWHEVVLPKGGTAWVANGAVETIGFCIDSVEPKS